MRVLVAGSGAVGSYFGGKLALAGHDVWFLARGAHGDAIRAAGVRLETPDRVLVARGPVFGSIGDACGLKADLVVVAVKTTSLQEVAAGVGDALAPHGIAVPLQNGLDSEVQLARAIGLARVVGAIARIAAARVEPGRVVVKAGGSLVVAPLEAARMQDAQRLGEVFRRADVPCDVHARLDQVLWRKLLWNAPFNAVCALTRRTPGQVLAVPSLERLVRCALLEVIEVARAEGVELSPALVDAMVDVSRSVFADAKPSMLQDVVAGRENEVEALQGAVVARGLRCGVPTPVHEMLASLLRGLQPGAKGRWS